MMMLYVPLRPTPAGGRGSHAFVRQIKVLENILGRLRDGGMDLFIGGREPVSLHACLAGERTAFGNGAATLCTMLRSAKFFSPSNGCWRNNMHDDDLDYTSGVAAFTAKHFSRAMQLLSPLAEAGHADAQHRVAIMHQNGLGVVSNLPAACKWMRAAAEQGHALAQHGMGFMYLEGEGVEADGAEAARWFLRAAEQGLAGSQTTLAMMYEEGRGVARDLDKARRWYRAAGFTEETE